MVVELQNDFVPEPKPELVLVNEFWNVTSLMAYDELWKHFLSMELKGQLVELNPEVLIVHPGSPGLREFDGRVHGVLDLLHLLVDFVHKHWNSKWLV